MSNIKHITWIETSYEDRLTLRVHGHNGLIEKAEWLAVIRGEVYGCVRVRGSFHTYFETYKVGRDGEARKIKSGSRPHHYEVIHEGKTVVLVDCNDHGEVPRRVPCTHCQARREAEKAA